MIEIMTTEGAKTMAKTQNECTDNIGGADYSSDVIAEDIWGNEFLDAPEDSDTAVGGSTLSRVPELKVYESTPEVVVKFGHSPIRYDSHFLKTWESERGANYVCHGPDCLACRAKLKKVSRRVEFFYRPASEEIVYRAFPEDHKPDGFRTRLSKACFGGYPANLMIQKMDQYSFKITRLEYRPELDSGVEVIRRFLTELQQNRVDFAGIMPEITVSDLAQVREVETVLIALGLMQ
jgi:hypothetical protein